MIKTIETLGVTYIISTKWDNNFIKIVLKINARDWKKSCNLEKTIFIENNFLFTLEIFRIFGLEEEWPDEIDYSAVYLFLIARSEIGNELYREQIEVSAKFNHGMNFQIKPEIVNI